MVCDISMKKLILKKLHVKFYFFNWAWSNILNKNIGTLRYTVHYSWLISVKSWLRLCWQIFIRKLIGEGFSRSCSMTHALIAIFKSHKQNGEKTKWRIIQPKFFRFSSTFTLNLKSKNEEKISHNRSGKIVIFKFLLIFTIFPQFCFWVSTFYFFGILLAPQLKCSVFHSFSVIRLRKFQIKGACGCLNFFDGEN